MSSGTRSSARLVSSTNAAIDGVLHSLVEVGEQHGCSLDSDEIDEF